MEIKQFDWTGKEWNSALTNTAKSHISTPMLAMCSPYLFNLLMTQGQTIRHYKNIPTPTIEPYDTYIEGQSGNIDRLVWQTAKGLPDDVLILSNLDTICIFYGFKSDNFKRTCDQMPLLLALSRENPLAN